MKYSNLIRILNKLKNNTCIQNTFKNYSFTSLTVLLVKVNNYAVFFFLIVEWPFWLFFFCVHKIWLLYFIRGGSRRTRSIFMEAKQFWYYKSFWIRVNSRHILEHRWHNNTLKHPVPIIYPFEVVSNRTFCRRFTIRF